MIQTTMPPLRGTEFTELMALLAGRFRARVGSWEIWNEPDNADFWLGSASDYAALLMAGGISFATPPPGKDNGPVEEGMTFRLFDEPRKEWLEWAPNIPISPE